MKKAFQILTLLLLCNILFGQSNRTKEIFYNLPLDKNYKDIDSIISRDTNFTVKHSHIGRSYYHTTRDSFFNSRPDISKIRIEHTYYEKDSALCATITRILIYKKHVSSKKISVVYNSIVNHFAKEFSYSKPEYIKGTAKQNGRETKVDEWMTDFFTNKKDVIPSVSVTWFDEGKSGSTMMVLYNLSYLGHANKE
jgi:hypothetical protein